jgi:hypothetical protein
VWLTAREVLLRQQAPYSEHLTREIQKGFYGRELDAANPGEPTDPQAFAYPLYIIFFLAPTLTLPFATVAEVFRWLLLLCTAASVPLWTQAIGVRHKLPFALSAMLLAVSNFPAVTEERQQNLTALALLLLAASVAVLVCRWLTLSGFLLALSTIKPQLSGLVICWLLLWAFSDLAHRKRLLWSFATTFLSLLAAACVLYPYWIGRFWAVLRLYQTYRADPSLVRIESHRGRIAYHHEVCA